MLAVCGTPCALLVRVGVSVALGDDVHSAAYAAAPAPPRRDPDVAARPAGEPILDVHDAVRLRVLQPRHVQRAHQLAVVRAVRRGHVLADGLHLVPAVRPRPLQRRGRVVLLPVPARHVHGWLRHGEQLHAVSAGASPSRRRGVGPPVAAACVPGRRSVATAPRRVAIRSPRSPHGRRTPAGRFPRTSAWMRGSPISRAHGVPAT